MFTQYHLNYRDMQNITCLSNYSSMTHKRIKNTNSTTDFMSNHLKEIFSLINSIDLNENILNHNIIIVGDQGSGKSSLLEYILNIDIFPQSLPSSNIPLKMTIESLDYNNCLCDECQENNFDKGISIKLKDKDTIYHLQDFHKFISDPEISSSKNEEEYINLELKLEKTSTDNQSKNFSSLQELLSNFSIYEIETNKLNGSNTLCKELVDLNNKIILFCVNSLKHEMLREKFQKIREFFKLEENENIFIILTKPDIIEHMRDLTEIDKLCKELKLNLTYVKMRSKDERNTFTNISKYSVEEQKFYDSKNYFRKYINCDQPGLIGVTNWIIKLVSKNFNNNQKQIGNFIKSNFLNKFTELVKLGDEIPSDLNIKKERLKSLLKNIFKISKKFLETKFEEINYFLERILHGISYEINEEYESSYLIKELTKISQINFHKLLNETSIISNICKTKFGKKHEIPTFKKLIDTINSEFIILILEKITEQLKYIFGFAVKHDNLDKINKEIELNFTNSQIELKNRIFVTFNELFENQIKEVFELIDNSNKIETNLFYFFKQEHYDELSKFYKDYILKIRSENITEQFLKRFLFKICKDKLNVILENNVKIFSFFFYFKLTEKIKEISIEKIIENLIGSDNDLNILEEKEDIRETRNSLKGDLDILILVIENLAAFFSGTRLNENLINAYINFSNNSFIDNFNKSLLISSPVNYQKGYNNKDINFYKNMMEKYKIDYDETKQDFSKFLGINQITDNFDKYMKDNSDIMRKPLGDSQESPQSLSTLEKKQNKNNQATCFVKFESEEFAIICDNTNEITVFNNSTKKIQKQAVSSIPYDKFLENNRYLNTGDIVYIAGGNKADGEITNLFYELKRPINVINILPSMKEKLCRNSMIYIPEENSIVSVGGTESKCCYKYDIELVEWEDFGKLKIEREDPSMILMNNSTLLCFGGIKLHKEKNFENLIEFKMIYESDWKIMQLDYDKNHVGLNYLSGAGIIPLSEQRLIVVGGYNNEEMKDEENIYEISIIQDYPLHLKIEKAKENTFKGGNKILSWFPESNFFSSEDSKSYANFDMDGEIILFNKENEEFNLVSFDFVK